MSTKSDHPCQSCEATFDTYIISIFKIKNEVVLSERMNWFFVFNEIEELYVKKMELVFHSDMTIQKMGLGH